MAVKSVFDFEDYRSFLKYWLLQARREKNSNLTKLAEVAQVHATFLSQVLSGNKELSQEQAILISDHLELTPLEKDFFFCLLNLTRAGNKKLREYWSEKRRDLLQEKNKLARRFRDTKELSAEQMAQFYSTWIYTAMQVATGVDGGQTLHELAERFALARPQAVSIAEFLTQSGLIAEKNGRYWLSEQHTHVPSHSPFVLKHHTNWRLKAVNDMANRREDELFFTCPLSLSKADFKVLRERINKLLEEFEAIVKASKAEEVACLNIDWFVPRP